MVLSLTNGRSVYYVTQILCQSYHISTYRAQYPFPRAITAMQSESQPPFIMPPRTTTDRLEDEETSSLSDYDSEWTQVSGTEDDSDYPPLTAGSDRPSSRADTVDGSIYEDVWEGFIDGASRPAIHSDTEARPQDIDATEGVPPNAQSLSTSVTSQASEDAMVNSGLESSLVGTLRASRNRSGSSSLHASLTESQSKLRLSFPDPLSSREDLDTESVIHDDSSPTSATEETCENVSVEDGTASFAEIEAPSTYITERGTDEHANVSQLVPPSVHCVLSIFLYGSAASLRWQIAERVMFLALQLDVKTASLIDEGQSRCYLFDHISLDEKYSKGEQPIFIRLIDRTSNFSDAVCGCCYLFL